MQIFGFKGYGITSVRAQGWERVVQMNLGERWVVWRLLKNSKDFVMNI